MAEHLTIPGALEWDAVERHSIATLRYAGGKEHDVKYVSEVAYDALKARLNVAEQRLGEAYDWGYSDGQNNPNGYSDVDDRGKCVSELMRVSP